MWMYFPSCFSLTKIQIFNNLDLKVLSGHETDDKTWFMWRAFINDVWWHNVLFTVTATTGQLLYEFFFTRVTKMFKLHGMGGRKRTSLHKGWSYVQKKSFPIEFQWVFTTSETRITKMVMPYSDIYKFLKGSWKWNLLL